MILITIGTDRKLAEEGSSVWNRTQKYADYFEDMYAVVFSLKTHGTPKNISKGNVHIFFTNVSNRLFYITRGYKIVCDTYKNIKDKNRVAVSTQDPFETGLVGYLMSKKYNIPLHVQVHTDIGSPYFSKNILNKIRLFISKFVLHQASQIRVVSPKIKQFLEIERGIAPEKITVLPILNSFTAEDRAWGNPYVLIVSRLEKEKKINNAIEAFAKATEGKNITLKILGDGREEHELKKLVRDLEINEKVEFLGYQHEIAGLYAKACCLLHTSLYEGFGLVLYEAFLSNCPIVTTNVGIAEEIQKEGFPIHICDVGDIFCLSSGITKYTEGFYTSDTERTLSFVAKDEEEYTQLYIESIEKSLM